MPDQPNGLYCIHEDCSITTYHKQCLLIGFLFKRLKYHPNPDNRAMDIFIDTLLEGICTANTGKLCLFLSSFVPIYGHFKSVHLFTLCDQSSSCICTHVLHHVYT